MERRVLIVEDEKAAAEILQDYLKASGFVVDILDNGLDVLDYVRRRNPDLLLLDIMLPGKDGLSLCREIRNFSQVPIIMTTAKVEEIDRLLGLEFGADDYICKPYSPREVVARVKAVLRRVDQQDGEGVCSIAIDETRNALICDGEIVELSAVEFKLFATLFATPGRIFSRAQLIAAIYPDHRTVSDRTVDSHIKKLRMKISSVRLDADCIHSVYGIGYKYDPV